MTPDLDQNLSLKASLVDKVSPVLKRIQQGIQSTREAFSGIKDSTSRTGDDVGQATGEMEAKVNQDLSKIQEGLKSASGAFEDFSGTAKDRSGKVGKAIQDAVYTKGAEDRLEDLDKDLGNLDKTFKGLASKQRAVTGKGRVAQAVSQDTINKKVIPAFQELHSTLDDYPDTLEEINRLEQDRLQVMEEGKGFFSKIEGRVSDAGENLKAASQEIKFGLQDMMGLVNAGIMGVTGNRVQEIQTGVAQVAGAEAFGQAPKVLLNSVLLAHTTMEVIEPFITSMYDLQSASAEVMPSLIEDFVNVSKATGDSADEITALHDQLVNLASVKGEDFLELYDNMKYFQENSRATWDDMKGAIMATSAEMLNFSEDSRQAYGKASLAAATAAKNLGASADTSHNLIETLLNDFTAMSRMQGIVGPGVNLAGLISQGEVDKAFDAIREGLKRQFGNVNTLDIYQRQYLMKMTAGTGLDMDTLTRILKGTDKTGTGKGGTATELAAQAVVEAPGTMKEAALAVRGTAEQKAEQITAGLQGMFIEPGRKLAEIVAYTGDQIAELSMGLAEGIKIMDEATQGKTTSAMAGYGAYKVTEQGLKIFGRALEKADIPVVSKLLGPDLAGESLLGKYGVKAASGALAYELTTNRNNLNDQNLMGNLPGGKQETTGLTKEQLTEALSGIDLSKFNLYNIADRQFLKEAGLLPFARAQEIAQMPQTINVNGQEIPNPAIPQAIRSTIGELPTNPANQYEYQPETFLGKETISGIEEVKKGADWVFNKFKDLLNISTPEGQVSRMEGFPGSIEVSDKHGEKRLTIQEQMLNELKNISNNLKPQSQNSKPTGPPYTPGVDRSREYLELERGYG